MTLLLTTGGSAHALTGTVSDSGSKSTTSAQERAAAFSRAALLGQVLGEDASTAAVQIVTARLGTDEPGQSSAPSRVRPVTPRKALASPAAAAPSRGPAASAPASPGAPQTPPSFSFSGAPTAPAGGGYQVPTTGAKELQVLPGQKWSPPKPVAPVPAGVPALPGSGSVPVDGLRCPVDGPLSFSNDWGAPRANGGHEGTDIFAKEGTPVVAVADAVIVGITTVDTWNATTGGGGLGGITVTYVTTSGDRVYNGHLVGIAPGLKVGAPVRSGQVVGYVGHTGNARGVPGQPDHNHFEFSPGGGEVTNPFPMLARTCAKLRR